MNFQLDLHTETISTAHLKSPLIVAPSHSVRKVLELLLDQKQGSVLVCDGEELVGIFTERNALEFMANDGDLEIPVEKVMSKRVMSLPPDASVSVAVRTMAFEGYRRIPILDEEGHPLGVCAASGVLRYLVDHFPEVVYTLPPEPHQPPQQREGA